MKFVGIPVGRSTKYTDKVKWLMKAWMSGTVYMAEGKYVGHA